MSLFFDVWTRQGFVLASDVKLSGTEDRPYAHKIQAVAPPEARITCGIAVCGDYPQSCMNFFTEAVSTKNTLREVAHHFARRWTEKYASDEPQFSAVHLVGYEEDPETGESVPQVWYWHTWQESRGYLAPEELRSRLATFDQPVPRNNHLPWEITTEWGKARCDEAFHNDIARLRQKLPDITLADEAYLFRVYVPRSDFIFTWNGDHTFWRSAAEAVEAAVNLLHRQSVEWTFEAIVLLTLHCLTFVTNIASLLPESSVGLSPAGELDLLTVKPGCIDWRVPSRLPPRC